MKNFPKMGYFGFLSEKVFKKLHFPNTLCSKGGVGGTTLFRSERGEPGGLFSFSFLISARNLPNDGVKVTQEKSGGALPPLYLAAAVLIHGFLTALKAPRTPHSTTYTFTHF